MEKTFREELLASWRGLREPKNRLRDLLENKFGVVSCAYVLNWTPEQDEDLYVVLVNGSTVFFIELSRSKGELLSFEEVSVLEYQEALCSRRERVRFAVALDLARK